MDNVDTTDTPAGRKLPRAVADAFRFDGSAVTAAPLAGGHIHHNVLVTCTAGRYVLQRLNQRVFPDIDAVLSNVERVVAHLEAGGRECPHLVETRSGQLSWRAADGTVWRAFHYLEATVGRTTPMGAGDAGEAARAFADYRVALDDLAGPPLVPTIARFHDLPHRLAQLDAADAADPCGRRAEVRHDIGRARSLGHEVVDALRRTAGVTPVRTVHNDAKLSNVRFDARTGLATCVVDLDTTMEGCVRFDIGELVRTVATHAAEDERDDHAVDFDLELLEALADGYFSVGAVLEPAEVESLALAGPEMAVENAVRFLTDHLTGDRYFAVQSDGQNLDRCRAQLRLTELMLASHTQAATCFRRAARRSRNVGPGAVGLGEGTR